MNRQAAKGRRKKPLGWGAPSTAQNGEDLIAFRLLRNLGIRSQCAVEFGATDGLYKSNTAFFRDDLGWRVIQFDSHPRESQHRVYKETITADNINDVFARHDVPHDLDLLSIDIDGNDLWVWKALTYRPTVVIIEYNARWRPKRRRTVPYDPMRNGWDHTDYYGASAGALVALGREKGYTLYDSTHSNLMFAPAGRVPEYDLCRVHFRKSDRPDPLKRQWIAYP